MKWEPLEPEKYVFFAGVGCVLPGSIITSEGAYVPRSSFAVVTFGEGQAAAGFEAAPAANPYMEGGSLYFTPGAHRCTTCGREHMNCCGQCRPVRVPPAPSPEVRRNVRAGLWDGD